MSTTRDTVREHYAAAARQATAGGGCCGDSTPVDVRFGQSLYPDAEGAPATALEASLACGNPTAVADLSPGEAVLDLGSGGGLDVLLAARQVGPTGHVYGLDMTEEMLELARRNAAEAGVDNVTFLAGLIEEIPLPDESINVVLSNCVVNLSDDKPAVFADLARVVRPGGRLAISDIVAEDTLAPAQRAERGSHVGCIAGALSEREYREALAGAGFTNVVLTRTHEVADRMHAAIVQAVRAA